MANSLKSIQLKHAFASAMLAAGWSLSVLVGCGVEHLDGGKLDVDTTRRLLAELPYRYEFREIESPPGSDGAIAGRAYGAHHTYIDFGISLGGSAPPVSVPQAGITEAERFPGAGYVFTANVLVPGKSEKWESGAQLSTGAQWREANRMVTMIEQKLCQEATDEPCPV